jgi:hypothetical protein
MDRGTVEFLIGVVVTVALWAIPREQAAAWLRRLGIRHRTPAPQPVFFAVHAGAAASASANVTVPSPHGRIFAQ